MCAKGDQAEQVSTCTQKEKNRDYNKNTPRKFPCSVYHTLLTSQFFYYLIRLKTQVAKIINQYNEKLQNHSFEVCQLKNKIKEVYNFTFFLQRNWILIC